MMSTLSDDERLEIRKRLGGTEGQHKAICEEQTASALAWNAGYRAAGEKTDEIHDATATGQRSVWRSLLSQCLAALGPDDPQAELAGMVAEVERLKASRQATDIDDELDVNGIEVELHAARTKNDMADLAENHAIDLISEVRRLREANAVLRAELREAHDVLKWRDAELDDPKGGV